MTAFTQVSPTSSHESSVQPTRSSQGAVPAWQSSVALHVSDPLQKSVSSQFASLVVLTHVSPTSSHESSVQPMTSSQFGAVPAWQSRVALHVSDPLQKSVSSQFASFRVSVEVRVVVQIDGLVVIAHA